MATNYKFTHTGIVRYPQCGSIPTKRRKRCFRETKKYWVTVNKVKFRKSNGWPAGEDWGWFVPSLELDTLELVKI